MKLFGGATARTVGLFLMAGLLVACAPARQAPDDYVGLRESQLYRYLGNPDRIESDGQGGRILIYTHIYMEEAGDLRLETQKIGNIKPTRTVTSGEIREKGFYINKRGYVYKVLWGATR